MATAVAASAFLPTAFATRHRRLARPSPRRAGAVGLAIRCETSEKQKRQPLEALVPREERFMFEGDELCGPSDKAIDLQDIWNKTWYPKAADHVTTAKTWYVVDATDLILGRLASTIAVHIRGKNEPTYTPSVDMGAFVIVVNAEKVAVSGKKRSQKLYRRHSGRPGGMKIETFDQLQKRIPERIIEHAVRGMLPKGRGFRKVGPEQWEFANDEFIRGQRHRLKNIHRRKPIFSHSSHTQGTPLADHERREYEEEIERLKSDNASLTSELEKNAQKKLLTERRMQELDDKLNFLEGRQRNLIAYVKDIVSAPEFRSSFAQQPDHGKKRRLRIPISLNQDAHTRGSETMHGDMTNSPVHMPCRESFDKMESSLNSLENFFREASEAFDISYDEGVPGPSSAVVITELHSSGETDPRLPSPPSRMCTSSAGVGDSHSSHGVTESTSCAESPPLSQMQPCTDSRAKVSEIDVNLEPAFTETGPSRDQNVEDPPAVAPGVNDGFWQQFLTEQPVSDAHQEAQSERRDGDNKADQVRIGDRDNFWWGKKSMEQMTEKRGHLTSAEKT
ncbi:hypothetical protein PR202_ga09659 [Eleusine coracana subsp. coracana]|uniref:50S ribosomal protein L13, chloroplastic n=1 Tax=Eleusine coracana subsp. coracana TaxID=191504 RepID=A0AAV5C518_ELECO|nr:hypothetical protein PR202_ga09659 [Eleusine coracana subsp. coracana]